MYPSLTKYPGLELRQGLFHMWPISVRFSLSEWNGDYQFLESRPHIAPHIPRVLQSPLFQHEWPKIEKSYRNVILMERNIHLHRAFVRAMEIIDICFKPTDMCYLVLQPPLNVSEITKQWVYYYIQKEGFKLISSDYESTNIPDEKKERQWYKFPMGACNIEGLIRDVCHMDYPSPEFGIQGDFFLINASNHLIVNMIADKWLDLISHEKKNLIPLIERFEEWVKHSKVILPNQAS